MVDENATPFEILGGGEPIMQLANKFYDTMERSEPELTQLHELDEQGRVSERSRKAFGLFLCFWLGGPEDYLIQHGHPRLRMRHAHLSIGKDTRDAWLRSMATALDECNVRGLAREFLNERFAHVADFLRNRE